MATEAEIHGSVKILKGPPEPVVLPSKGVGVFMEGGKLRFYVLSRFNESDTTVRTPVSFRNAWRLFWNLWRSS
jgi:hypothetical protein